MGSATDRSIFLANNGTDGNGQPPLNGCETPNGRRGPLRIVLAQLRGFCAGAPSRLVGDGADVDPHRIVGVGVAGRTAGASAPEYSVLGVIVEDIEFRLPAKLVKGRMAQRIVQNSRKSEVLVCRYR